MDARAGPFIHVWENLSLLIDAEAVMECLELIVIATLPGRPLSLFGGHHNSFAARAKSILWWLSLCLLQIR
jgi:hypothetical protein